MAGAVDPDAAGVGDLPRQGRREPQRTAYTGPLLIHAALTIDEQAVWPAQATVTKALERRQSQPRGVLLGVVQLVEVTDDARSPWAIPGAWHWRLARPRLLPAPILRLHCW